MSMKIARGGDYLPIPFGLRHGAVVYGQLFCVFSETGLLDV